MSNILSTDKFRLPCEISDGAFVFVNEFSLTIHPSNIASCTEAVEGHGSRFVVDIESLSNFFTSLDEGKRLPRSRLLHAPNNRTNSVAAIHRLISTTFRWGLMMRSTCDASASKALAFSSKYSWRS